MSEVATIPTILGNVLSSAKTEAAWAEDTRVLPYGYIAVSFDGNGVKKLKIGDGVKVWSELDFFEAGGGSPSPELDGITGLFLSDGTIEGNNWHNNISGGADMVLTSHTRGNDGAVILPAGGQGLFASSGLRVMYCVCKIPAITAARGTVNAIISIGSTTNAAGRIVDIELDAGDGGAEMVELTVYGAPYVGLSTFDVDNYHVYAYLYQPQINTYGHNAGYLFVDGDCIGVRSDSYVTDAYYNGRGYIGVGGRNNTAQAYPIKYPTHYLAVMFGSGQTMSEVVANCRWLAYHCNINN